MVTSFPLLSLAYQELNKLVHQTIFAGQDYQNEFHMFNRAIKEGLNEYLLYSLEECMSSSDGVFAEAFIDCLRVYFLFENLLFI